MPRKIEGMDRITQNDLAAIHSIARSAVGVAGIMECEVCDIKQSLALRLVQKAHFFRCRTQSWGTFRKAVLTRCLSDIIKRRMQPCCRHDYVGRASLDEMFTVGMGPEGEEFATLGEMVTAEGLLSDDTEKPEIPGLDLKIDMEIFIESLPIRHRRICKALMAHTPQKAMLILKIPRTTFYRCMNDIKEGMKKAGFENYFSPQNGTLF